VSTCDGSGQATGGDGSRGAHQRPAGEPRRAQQARPRAHGRRQPPQLGHLRLSGVGVKVKDRVKVRVRVQGRELATQTLPLCSAAKLNTLWAATFVVTLEFLGQHHRHLKS